MCNMGPETEPFTHQTSETQYHRRTNNWQGHTRAKKTHIYEQRGLHKDLDPIVRTVGLSDCRIIATAPLK